MTQLAIPYALPYLFPKFVMCESCVKSYNYFKEYNSEEAHVLIVDSDCLRYIDQDNKVRGPSKYKLMVGRRGDKSK